MATTTIERLLVRIEADAAVLQTELAKSGGALKQFGATATQTQAAAGSLGQRYASAAVQISSAAENMARAGKVGGEGLKQIITQGAQMALMFGATGTVVGAIGIAGLAIVEIFRATSAETARLLDQIAARSGQAARAQITAVRTAQEQLSAEIRRIEASPAQLGGGASGATIANPNRQRLAAAREELRQLVEEEGRLIAVGAQQREDAAADELRTLVRLRQERALSAQQAARLNRIEAETVASIRTLRNNAGRGTEEQQQGIAKALVRQLDLLKSIRGEGEKGNPLRDLAQGGNAALTDANAQLTQYRAKIEASQRDLVKLLSGADQQLAEASGDAVLLLDRQIQDVTEEARRLGATDADIARIVRPLQLARDAAIASATAFKTLSLSAKEQAELSKTTETAAQRQARIEAQTAAVRLENLERLRDGLQETVNISAGIATALFGADSAITRMVGGVGQLVTGFTAIAELAIKTEGGLGALLTSGAGLASAASGIGAVIAGIGAIASVVGSARSESPEARALREALEENAARLVELTAGIEELTLTLTARETSAVRDVALEQEVSVGPEGFGVTLGARPIADVLADLRKAGVSLEELRRVAADFGITLSETPTIAQLKALQEAIGTFSLEKLLNTLDGQLKLLDLRARIDPKAFDGLAGIVAKLDVLSGKNGKGGIPAIAQALAGLDPTAPDFAEKAIEKLRSLFDNVAGLDLSAFGDIDPAELPGILAELIEALQNTLPKVATAAELFAEAFAEVGILAEFGLLKSAEEIKAATIAAFNKAFGAQATLDFSSLEAFEESVRLLLEGFLADGELSDEELAIIDGIRRVRQAFEDTAPEAIRFTDAIQALEDRFRLLGTTAREQVAQLLAAFTSAESIDANANFSLLQGLLDGLDVTSAEGLALLRERAGAILAALAEGGITEQEQAIIDALQRILGVAVQAADDAARDAEAAANADLQRRRRILQRASEDLELQDIDDPAAILKARLAAFKTAFGDLIDLPADLEGLTGDALDAALVGLVEQLRALGDGAELAGIPVEVIIEALLGLESAGDAATQAIETLAQRLQTAFDAVEFDLDLEGVTDPLQRAQRKLAAVAKAIPDLEQVVSSFNLTSPQGRAAAEAALVRFAQGTTDQAVREAILNLLGEIRRIPAVSEDAGTAASAGAGGRTGTAGDSLSSGIDRISEVTATRMEGWLAQIAANTKSSAVDLSRVATVLGVPSITLSPPAVSFGSSVRRLEADGAASLGGPSVTINYYGNVTVRDAQEFARLQAEAIRTELGATLALESRVASRARGDIRALPS